MEKKKVEVTRIIVREKHPYARPARYSSSMKYILIIDSGEHDFYPNSKNFKNYPQFIEWVKKRFGIDCDYKIDLSKPYVHYI